MKMIPFELPVTTQAIFGGNLCKISRFRVMGIETCAIVSDLMEPRLEHLVHTGATAFWNMVEYVCWSALVWH